MSETPESQLGESLSSLTDEDFRLPSQRAIRAAYQGDLGAMAAILEAGYEIDEIDGRTGLAALHIAVGRNDLAMVKFLVERGASFFADRRGRWPSTIASLCEVSEELCDYIADAEAGAEDV
ncbi:MAG: ankyrin repeat domain-containing protein [Mesorhizobium sp.]